MTKSPYRVVALLDSMWGETERSAPRWFRISPTNFSGRRLYKLLGDNHVDLLVTNCCPIMQVSAHHHGIPDPDYVAENLRRLAPFSLLLVCGQVAQRTYYAAGDEVAVGC